MGRRISLTKFICHACMATNQVITLYILLPTSNIFKIGMLFMETHITRVYIHIIIAKDIIMPFNMYVIRYFNL